MPGGVDPARGVHRLDRRRRPLGALAALLLGAGVSARGRCRTSSPRSGPVPVDAVDGQRNRPREVELLADVPAVTLAVDRLITTWPDAAGHFPSIRRWAHAPVRRISGIDVLNAGDGRDSASEYTGGPNSPCPARLPSASSSCSFWVGDSCPRSCGRASVSLISYPRPLTGWVAMVSRRIEVRAARSRSGRPRPTPWPPAPPRR